jgi:ribosome-associated translation inhibitor RaiA
MAMNGTETVQVRVEVHGRVPGGARELAAAKIGALFRLAAEPLLSARVMLAVAADPAVARPALAQATLNMNGRIIRAQATEQTTRSAIDRVVARLRVRLDRAARNWAALRGTRAAGEPGGWRHQSVPAHRPAYVPGTGEERDVIRRGSYAAGPETPQEAAAELDLLDYDFHLFTERSTGLDSVIYRAASGYRLALADPAPGRLGPVPESIGISPVPAPRLTIEEAARRLDAMGEPFMFFIDTQVSRGSLIYHRYDGRYGLIHPLAGPARGS